MRAQPRAVSLSQAGGQISNLPRGRFPPSLQQGGYSRETDTRYARGSQDGGVSRDACEPGPPGEVWEPIGLKRPRKLAVHAMSFSGFDNSCGKAK